MSEINGDQDSDEILTPKSPKRNKIQVFTHAILNFFLFFHQPVRFFKNMKPRKKLTGELFSTTLNLLIPAIAFLVGGLAVTWRVFSYGKQDTPFNWGWAANMAFILLALIIIGSPSLIYLLHKNWKNKEKSRFHMVLYSFRQWYIQYIPFAVGFTLLFLAFVIQKSWNIERVTIYFIFVLHVALIWQCMIFSSLVYAISDNKTRSILFGIFVFASIIIGEQVLAIVLNDIIWEDWTILAMFREWMWYGMFG